MTLPEREDHELIIEVESEVGARLRVWRVKFDDPFPVRIEAIDDDGHTAEVWLGDSESRTVARAMDVIE